MGWMTMAHVPCFAMAHIDFIKSWLAGLVYWPHAFPLMRIYNGDIHIIYTYHATQQQKLGWVFQD